MSTASMMLLKGAQLPPPGIDPSTGSDTAQTEEEQDMTFDVDKMVGKEIDALVVEQGIDTPANWSKLKVQEKRDWLKANFDEVPDSPDPSEAPSPAHSEAQPVEDEAPAEAPAEAQQPEPVAAAEPSKPKAKSKAKKPTGKALVADTSLVGEVLEPDVISDVAYTIENLKQNQAHQMLVELREQQELNTFKLGGVLSMIQEQGWFAPYGSFKEYVEQEHLIRHRTALYWIRIYRSLLESGISWDKVKHLGWTKVKELAAVMTAENADEWIDIAEQQTALQLIETVKKSIAEDEGEAPGSAPTKEVVNRSFKLHTDQRETVEAAIAKARELSGTSVDTVALEYICLEFLGGKHQPAKAVDLGEQLAKAGLDDALAAFEAAFPTVGLTLDPTET